MSTLLPVYHQAFLTFLKDHHFQTKAGAKNWLPLFIAYHMIQNFGGRKLWKSSSHQKLADNILVNAQNLPKCLK